MAFGRFVEVSSGPKNGEGIAISELKISFKVDKSNTATPNKASIIIYNLSEKTAKQIGTQGNRIILKAGYLDETVAAIFFGEVTYSKTSKKGTERVTEIEAQEAVAKVTEKTISKSYADNTLVSTVLKDFTDALGLPVKGADGITAGLMYEKGYSFQGLLINGIKEILNRVKFTYTIQDEQLCIFEPGKSITSSNLILSKTSGLLTRPTAMEDKTKNVAAVSFSGGYTFNTLLFPDILPGTVVNIDDPALSGEVRIDAVTFSGDNWTGSFIAEVEASKIGGTVNKPTKRGLAREL